MGSEFVVDSKGHCFLCLRQLSSSSPVKEWARGGPESGPAVTLTYSFQSLSRYLEMDLKKLFLEKGIIPPMSWRNAIREEKLGVALCGGCASLGGRFSWLCKQLEDIQREVKGCLSQIHRKLLGDDEEERTEGDFRRKLEESKNKSPSSRGKGRRVIGKLEIVDVMRTEALQKCVQKLSSADAVVPARDNVPELRKADKVKGKVKVIKGNTSRDELQNDSDHSQDLDPEFDPTATIKLEDPEEEPQSGGDIDCDDLDLNTEGHSDSLEESDSAPEETTPVYSKYSLIIVTPSHQPPEDPDKPSSTMNFATGKVKCNLCPSAEFKNNRYFQAHYQGVHLKIRYKCTLCSKEFTQRPSFDRHHRSAHMKLRFKCDLCPKTFTLKSHMKVHRKGVHFGHKFKCKYCPSFFTQMASMTRHMKRTCEGQVRNNRRGDEDQDSDDSGSGDS